MIVPMKAESPPPPTWQLDVEDLQLGNLMLSKLRLLSTMRKVSDDDVPHQAITNNGDSWFELFHIEICYSDSLEIKSHKTLFTNVVFAKIYTARRPITTQ